MIRFSSLTLTNFKNVDHGTISFPSASAHQKGQSFVSDIVGIYGQNGSGKTSVIEAFEVVKTLMSGESLSPEVHDFLPVDKDEFQIDVAFLLDQRQGVVDGRGTVRAPKTDEASLWHMEYCIAIAKNDARGFCLAHEKLTAKNLTRETKRTVLFEASVDQGLDSGNVIHYTPVTDWNSLLAGRRDTKERLNVQLHIANERKQSMIFSHGVFSVFDQLHKTMMVEREDLSAAASRALPKILSPLILLVPEIAFNAIENMAVIRTSSHTEILLDYLHIHPGASNLGEVPQRDLRIDLLRPSTLGEDSAQALDRIIESINKVLSSLVPGFSLYINKLGRETMEDGSVGVRVEALSQRGSRRIPLRCESEGIKKLVSITNLLVGVYNNPSALLAVDELDSGVFEYLLGQIVETFSQYARGQLIFTAHNLYPLEKLNARSVVFTTSNPANRYITLKGIKSNNNLRDVYLREIELGGQVEPMYENTNRFEIDNALYEAGLPKTERMDEVR